MKPSTFCSLARRLMQCAAVPYQEQAVSDEVSRICSEHDLNLCQDKFGNLLIDWKQGSNPGRPLVLAAHMDHPGFEILRPCPGTPGRWEARFLGGVGEAYFKPGVPLRLMPGNVEARLGKRLARPGHFEILATAAATLPEKPQLAVWDVVDFKRVGKRIMGRACDDLIGVASILSVLIQCRRSRRSGWVIGVISRAEEVGFQGALALAAARELPPSSLVISLETSREMAPVTMGQGVIVRVGDRASVFDSDATRFLTLIAQGLQAHDKTFQFQRAWMGGGTCEGTAFQEYGYQTGAVCVALGNYHNCAEKQTIAPEFVEVADACGMVDLLVEAAVQIKHFDRLTGKLKGRLKGLLREGERRLLS